MNGRLLETAKANKRSDLETRILELSIYWHIHMITQTMGNLILISCCLYCQGIPWILVQVLKEGWNVKFKYPIDSTFHHSPVSISHL